MLIRVQAIGLFIVASLAAVLLSTIPLSNSQAQPLTGPDEPATADSDMYALLQARIVRPDSSRPTEPTASAPQYPARSTTPLALTGNIAFETDRTGPFDVYAKDADGSRPPAPLAVSSGNDVTPVWSPDSTQIAFASDRDGDFDVYLRTASDGHYALSGLAAGTYILTPTLSNWTFIPPTLPVTVPPSATGQDFSGVPPPCDLNKQPVLLVHGWGGPDDLGADESGFRQLVRWMQADGYEEGCNLFYATGVRPTNSRISNAIAIQRNLHTAAITVTALNPAWDGHFDIIGHSYGGLNARFYLESPLYADDANNPQREIQVDNLFTLGSPHGGALIPEEAYPAAIGIAWNHIVDPENLYDFLSAVGLLSAMMDNYNLAHRQPPNVCYRLIGGDFLQQPDVPGTVRLMYLPWNLSPGDIAVSQRSSLQLGLNPLLRLGRYPNVVIEPNTDMHGYATAISKTLPIVGDVVIDLSHLRSYVYPGLTYQQVISPNLDAGMSACRAARDDSLSTLEAEGEALVVPRVLLASDAITAGQTVTGTLPVDWSGRTAWYVKWTVGELSLTLREPSGVVFTPAVAIGDPNADYGELTFDGASLATYVFTNTLTGEWTYTVTAVSGPYPIHFDLYANPDSSLVARASAPEWQPLGAPVVIAASLFYSTTPVSGATVQAHVTRPDGGEDITALSDDGVPPDGAAGDGIYSGTYTDTTAGGFYHVLVEADGTYASQTYHRSAQTVFSVADDSAKLHPIYTGQPKDDDGDGLYEYLDVNAGVSVTQPGDFTVAAVLYGGDGRYIDLANATVYSSTGPTTLTLRFDGRAIRASKLDGPYTVTEVLLLDDAALIKLDEADGVWVTPPYDHRQFGVWSELVEITKTVTPRGPVNYGDELTYTLVISAPPGEQVRLYDPLEDTTWVRFVEQPEGVVHVDTFDGTLALGGAITGTLTVTPTDQITVSFIVRAGVPGTVGWTATVSNRACLYPFGGTLGGCVWSNDVTNPASHPHAMYLPLVLRDHP